MQPDRDAILNGALALPAADRATLAARLLDSLDDEDDGDVRIAWEAEVARRLAEIDSGAVELVPWPEANRRISGDGDGRA